MPEEIIASPEVSDVSPSVDAGAVETAPVEGSAPSADTVETPATPTIDDKVMQQKSFAARLSQEKAKLEEAYKPHQQLSSQLEGIARRAGFSSAAEYTAALEESIRAHEAEQEAAKLGVDQETYQQHFQPTKEKLSAAEQRIAQLEQADLQRAVKAEYEGLLTTYPDFKALEQQIFDLVAVRPIKLEEAYKLVSFDNKIAQAKAEGEAAAVRALQSNADSSTGPVGGDAPSQTFDFTKLSPTERESYYRKALNGELKNGLR